MPLGKKIATLSSASFYTIIKSLTTSPRKINYSPIILQVNQFIQLNVTERIKQIEIHDRQRVILIKENGEKIAIALHFIGLPPTNSHYELKFFLTHAVVRISQFNDGSYRLDTNLRGLGGGQGSSKASNKLSSLNKGDKNSLWDACQAGSYKKANKILKKECYAADSFILQDAHHEENYSCLNQALNSKNEDYLAVVRLLQAKGASVNYVDANQQTPLLIAILKSSKASQSDVDLIRFLIEHGANVNFVDKYGNSLLHNAIKKDLKEIVDALIEGGADVNATDSIYGTLLHRTLVNDVDINPEMARPLIEGGANLSTIDRAGNTAFTRAIKINKPEIVELLLKRGADPNAVDTIYGTVFRHAISKSEQLALLLFDAGADINILRVRQGPFAPSFPQKKESVLYDAVFHGHVNLIRKMLPIIKNGENEQLLGEALNLACSMEREDIIKLLLEAGVNPRLISYGNYKKMPPRLKDFILENSKQDEETLQPIALHITNEVTLALNEDVKLSSDKINELKLVLVQSLTKLIPIVWLTENEDAEVLQARSRLARAIKKKILPYIKDDNFDPIKIARAVKIASTSWKHKEEKIIEEEKVRIKKETEEKYQQQREDLKRTREEKGKEANEDDYLYELHRSHY